MVTFVRGKRIGLSMTTSSAMISSDRISEGASSVEEPWKCVCRSMQTPEIVTVRVVRLGCVLKGSRSGRCSNSEMLADSFPREGKFV